MKKHWQGMLGLAGLVLAGCEGAQGEVTSADVATAQVSPLESAVTTASTTPAISMPSRTPAAPRTTTSILDDDPDGDGIADFRLIISRTYAIDGTLLSETHEEDFDADGIVDTRSTVNFAP